MEQAVTEAVRILREGGVILYPTDTVWGIGCDATNAEAVERIYRLKRSENKKSMLVLCATPDMVVRYVHKAPGIAFEVQELATKPLTLILPGASGVAANLIPEEGTLGVRIPDHAFCQAMLRKLGRPIVSTSANISGEDTPRNLAEISREIIDGVDYVHLMARIIKTLIQKRVSDIDMFQHVNNVSQQMYFDVGKADFYRQVLQDDVLSGTSRIITAATANSFKEQIRMEDDIYVTTTVAKVGNKSITLFQQIIGRNAAGRETVKTESTSVMVAFDFDRQESVTVPERWRRNLAD